MSTNTVDYCLKWLHSSAIPKHIKHWSRIPTAATSKKVIDCRKLTTVGGGHRYWSLDPISVWILQDTLGRSPSLVHGQQHHLCDVTYNISKHVAMNYPFSTPHQEVWGLSEVQESKLETDKTIVSNDTVTFPSPDQELCLTFAWIPSTPSIEQHLASDSHLWMTPGSRSNFRSCTSSQNPTSQWKATKFTWEDRRDCAVFIKENGSLNIKVHKKPTHRSVFAFWLLPPTSLFFNTSPPTCCFMTT